MRMTKKEKNIFKRFFGVYDYPTDYELEQWTNGGVDMLIYLDKDSNKNATEQFEEYINNFDIDEEIDLYRECKDYKNVFTIRQSLNDFESWLKYCEDILTLLKA